MKARIQLTAPQSRRALEHAIHSQAQIVLKGSASPAATINGFLISGDDEALLIEVTGRPPVELSKLLNTQCDITIFADQHYGFSSTVTAVPQGGVTRSLAIARPTSIFVQERRRTARVELAQSSRLWLEYQGGEGWKRQAGVLLNISGDGLACRVEKGGANGLGERDALRVRFELPAHPAPFDLPAVVSNKTPASEGGTILGLQFVRSARSAGDLDVLQRALKGAVVAEAAV